MPIYEYRCTKCEHTLEAFQKMSDKPLRKCPVCGKAGLEKLVSAASFRLKGGGWYETDFKTGGKKQLADTDSGASGGGNKDGAKSSGDSKPESGKKAAKATGATNKKPAPAGKSAAGKPAA